MRKFLAAAVVALVLTGCAPTAEPAAVIATSTPDPTATAEVTPAPTPTFEAMDPSLFYVTGMPANFGSWDTEDVNFAAPSGDLGCAVLGEEHDFLWGCTIDGNQLWEFPSDSPSDYCFEAPVSCGRGIEVDGSGLPHPRLRSDPGFPGSFAATPGAEEFIRVLELGQSVTFGDVTCVSETIGITCSNAASGHGFTIAHDRNDIW